MYTAHPLGSIWWVTSAVLQHIVAISITFFSPGTWNKPKIDVRKLFIHLERYRCFHINVSYFVCLIKQFPYSCLKHWPHEVFGILCSMLVLSWSLFGKRINCQRKSFLMLRKKKEGERDREKNKLTNNLSFFNNLFFNIHMKIVKEYICFPCIALGGQYFILYAHIAIKIIKW